MTQNDTMRKKKKKRGRKNKMAFGSCFRSFPNTPSSYNDHSKDRDVKNGNKPVLVGVTGCQGKEFVSDDVSIINGNDDCGVKRSNQRRKFSRVMKAVFFGSLMAKKIHRTSSKSSVASDTSTSYSALSSEKISKSSDGNKAFSNECTDMDDSCSRQSSSNLLSSSSRTTCSSYSSSSRSSNNSNNAQSSCESKPSSQIKSCVLLPISKPKPSNTISRASSYQKGFLQLEILKLISSALSSPGKTINSSKNWNIKWCLFLLLSLIVLVMYGRIFSILCTSTGFYFVPCRKMKHVKSVTKVTKVLDTDSEQYKKRVIMAGLLDRTRNPIR